MNREILFKAKRVDNGEWVEGSLIVLDADSGYYFITEPFLSASTLPVRDLIYNHTHLVDPATICQYTGLTDKNGKKIFEGDIIKIPDDYDEYGHNAGEKYEVYFNHGGFRLKPKYSKARGYWLEDNGEVEVISNIFDHPELLRGEDDETD